MKIVSSTTIIVMVAMSICLSQQISFQYTLNKTGLADFGTDLADLGQKYEAARRSERAALMKSLCNAY